MNTDRETTQGARSMEGRDKQSRAGTAVFVGRASFRMIAGSEGPGEEIGYPVVGDATPTPVPTGDSENRWFAPVGATESAERSEAVVLMPPDIVMRTAAGEQSNEAAFEAKLDRRLEYDRRSSARRATSRWAIAAAVIVGATATLSAQAVMRRPGRLARDAAQLTVQSGKNNTGTTEIAGLAPSSALVNVTTPTVVPSTATFRTDEPAAARSILRLVAVNRPARNLARATARGSAESRPAKAVLGAPTATAWIDPFVDDVPAASREAASHNGKRPAARRGSGVSAQKTAGAHSGGRGTVVTWDDPFVQ